MRGRKNSPALSWSHITFFFLGLLLGPLAVPGFTFSPILLWVRSLAEVNSLSQLWQVLGHGQRGDVCLCPIQSHLLHLLLTGGLDADPHCWTTRHDGRSDGRDANREIQSLNYPRHNKAQTWLTYLRPLWKYKQNTISLRRCKDTNQRTCLPY